MDIKTVNEMHEKRYNCAQIVFAHGAEVLGFDKNTALKIAGPFGSGMYEGETCGCVTGALMALGLKYGQSEDYDLESKKRTTEMTNKFQDIFASEYESLKCRDLLGINVTLPGNRAKAAESGVLKLCPELMKFACDVLEDLLNE